MFETSVTAGLAILSGLYLIYRVIIRLRLSRAKHPSLRGHARWSRRIARWIPFFEYGPQQFFVSDGAPPDIARKRRERFDALCRHFQQQSARSAEFTEALESSVSDVHFTNAYRVPFPYRNFVTTHLPVGQVVEASSDLKVRDLDGEWRHDLSGSYGVNVFGYDFYKACMQAGFEATRELGPVLGPYHPLIRDNVDRLKAISGLDEVSFHMSGTEAVMQAVRLARYHTGRSHLVRLCGAYHGWWDGVQPGIGNRRKAGDVYTLADLSGHTLRVLESRNDIACVLINPIQALNPNSDAASDATLVTGLRSADYDRKRYTNWLKRIREICTRRSIVLIFDEVFTGFRLGYRGAQAFFDIQADIVTYGKSLGGGLPVGAVCGRHALMKRFQDDRPVNVSFARGTFNSHPTVMATMNAFLMRIESTPMQQRLSAAAEVWDRRTAELNARLESEDLPVRVANLSSIWSVLYTRPGRYHWMFQYYLRRHGIALGWTGTGRLIMCLNYSDTEYGDVMECFVDAARAMERDGWWWTCPQLTTEWIKREMLKGMLAARFPVLNRFIYGRPGSACPDPLLDEV